MRRATSGGPTREVRLDLEGIPRYLRQPASRWLVVLPGLAADDARELQRRLTAARTPAAPSQRRDGGPTPS